MPTNATNVQLSRAPRRKKVTYYLTAAARTTIRALAIRRRRAGDWETSDNKILEGLLVEVARGMKITDDEAAAAWRDICRVKPGR